MTQTLLQIQDLHVTVENREILKGVSLGVNKGEVHVLMGPNGSGKSTLVNCIMGHPKYQISGGSITFEGENITAAKAHERAKKGIFLSFQNPEEIPGITVENLLRTARTSITGELTKVMAFKKELSAAMKSLNMDASYASRYLNVGFSGGEKKKNEILQMMMLNPKLAILDETDSGLDVDAVKIVSAGVNSFRKPDNAILIITHNTKILEHLAVDAVHVLINGQIVQNGSADLVKKINETGFVNLKNSLAV